MVNWSSHSLSLSEYHSVFKGHKLIYALKRITKGETNGVVESDIRTHLVTMKVFNIFIDERFVLKTFELNCDIVILPANGVNPIVQLDVIYHNSRVNFLMVTLFI